MKFLKRGMLLCTVLTFLLVGGCGPADEAPPDDDMTEEETAPDEADAQLIAEGEAVVQKNCISCHGENLEGGMGPALHGLSAKYTPDQLHDILVNGIGAMPGGTAGGQEEAVIAYLLTLD
ncbi:cytochrome c551 [Caldalkalibacillus uzonensis]|uniref:Cytochrome c551 n=1 Tax=Caldalkalibacillus uzonensis TaxID=353224 RepID=A0ABU0CT39_9BACI|nr:cytochrome c [Caldalkalibacillus uzonensis]MDQ0339576.1 cytochrome c551 [Caldalkalibacillus uzonensis]